ncbi:MAG TPA: TIGR02281 family clan AA aspartic protease [Allosphingosinicella sp.]|nr:TIGR02281 family clan AA aspartic protease [Allosphingosinicella sp.]
MQKALFLVLAAGTGLGLLWPSGKQAPPVAATVPASKAGSGQSYTIIERPRETVLERRGNGHFYVDARVNGELVNFVVDTGAFGVILPVETARRLNIPFAESEFETIASGASGPVRGKLIQLDRVSIDGKEVRNVTGAIADGLDQPLLGQAYLSRLSVEMTGDYMRLK